MLRKSLYHTLLSYELTDVSISAYPNLEFLIIVNPNSGPGAAPWWPNEDYVRELPRLNAHPSVTTIGYIRATYCQRPVEDVARDIEAYAMRSGSEEFPGLQVQGIFVDETVNLFSGEAKRYLDGIDRKVKENNGIDGNRIVRSFSCSTYSSANSVSGDPQPRHSCECSACKSRSGHYGRGRDFVRTLHH